MLNILILGASGFIGTSLATRLAKVAKNSLSVYDRPSADYSHLQFAQKCWKGDFSTEKNFDEILQNIDIVYHLISTSRPYTKYEDYFVELTENVAPTLRLLKSCVACKVKQVVFVSSGGTVYGANGTIPLKETMSPQPITSYGIQKMLIERYLHLFYMNYGLDYRAIRLSNPYGIYQQPNSGLGAISTFTYRAVNNQPITIFGDGENTRDYIYIEDAIDGLILISNQPNAEKIINLGSGKGYTLNQIIGYIEHELKRKIEVQYQPARDTDVRSNILCIDKYKTIAPDFRPLHLQEGIAKMIQHYIQEEHVADKP